ncbi:unnamed protein product [Cuscuta campestris]|uniref:Glycosyl transferase CAP10 domain-containing protein n=1 Tax=Cuscuta campestris TaxID=132261 RepID=A0A484LEL0_9ASTE|nr:unnamed protein product [Cuscuta campestris]
MKEKLMKCNKHYRSFFGHKLAPPIIQTKRLAGVAAGAAAALLLLLYIIATKDATRPPLANMKSTDGDDVAFEFPLDCAAWNKTNTCPRNYPTSSPPANLSPAAGVPGMCPEYFRWIHEDLKPWKETGITREMVEKGRRSAHFRLVVSGGRMYVEKYRKSIQSRALFSMWGMVQLLRWYPGKLPDLELMFDCDDRPVVRAKDFRNPNSGPPPVFRYCSDERSLDIVFPDWSFWGWAETNIRPWRSVMKDIKEGNKRKKWKDRVPLAYWKGNPKVTPSRTDLMKCNLTRRHNFNTLLYVQAQAIGEAGSKFIQEDMKMEKIYDFMYHLLNEYAKTLRFKPEIPPNAVELCAEALACPINGMWRKFMDESLEKSPSYTHLRRHHPCTLPPPYDPQELEAFLGEKMEATKQVETREKDLIDASFPIANLSPMKGDTFVQKIDEAIVLPTPIAEDAVGFEGLRVAPYVEDIVDSGYDAIHENEGARASDDESFYKHDPTSDGFYAPINTLMVKSLDLIPLFSFPPHLSTIKCADVCGSAAVSGGSDDTIKIYDPSLPALRLDPSTINSLAFVTPPPLSFPRNLISAADDGTVSIYDADPFVHLKTLKVHRKGINSISIHPSGRLGLSVGRDECLAMINLVRGRRSFYCRLGKEASIVKFSETGETFYMVMDKKVSVHESGDARIAMEFDNAKQVLCATPGKGGILFTGGEDQNITAWDTKSGKVAYSIIKAHSARIKGIVVLSHNDNSSVEVDPYLVASASSDGNIRVWDIRNASKEESGPLAEANTKSRLTCLAGSSIKLCMYEGAVMISVSWWCIGAKCNGTYCIRGSFHSTLL